MKKLSFFIPLLLPLCGDAVYIVPVAAVIRGLGFGIKAGIGGTELVIGIADLYLIPLIRRAVEIYIFNACTAIERITVDAFYAFGNYDFGKGGAVAEAPSCYRCNAFRNGYACKRAAIAKCTFAYFDNTFGNHNARKLIAGFKGHISDFRNA